MIINQIVRGRYVFASLLSVAVGQTPLMADAACLNNTVEFKSDSKDATYFHLQKFRSTIRPAIQYFSSDGEQWEHESVAAIPGSQLQPVYAPAWSIEVHYHSKTVDSLGSWKESALTGNRYGVLRGKHVPSSVMVDYPATYSEQDNTHLSQQFVSRSRDWNGIATSIDNILEDNIDDTVPGYPSLTRSSPPQSTIGKLSKWIKNKRLDVLMDGGGNVDGAIHPMDFINRPPSYCQGAASTMAIMAAQLGVPARLGETSDHSWAEVLIDGQWRFVENQPETFLDVVDPPVAVWTYQKNGEEARGFQPKSGEEKNLALNREAMMSASLIDIVADPQSFGMVDGANRYSWFFDWSNPFVYDEQGNVSQGESAMVVRPEVYSDSVFNYYTCDYNNEHNSSQCGGEGRQFSFGHWYASQWELAALYPGREKDLPYVFAKDNGDDRHVMYLTPIRGKDANNKFLEQTKVSAGEAVRQQFYLSETDNISAVFAVLYLGQDGQVDYTIPKDGGDWYLSVNGNASYLRHRNGMSAGDGLSDGVEENYLGLGQTVLRFEIDIKNLTSSKADCDR